MFKAIDKLLDWFTDEETNRQADKDLDRSIEIVTICYTLLQMSGVDIDKSIDEPYMIKGIKALIKEKDRLKKENTRLGWIIDDMGK